MQQFRAVIIAATIFLCSAAIVRAQDVTLTSGDGVLSVSGTLLGYDGEFYRLRSEFGDLTLDGTGVHCAGPGCPTLGAYIARVRIAGAAELGATLMPQLIEGFARAEGLLPRRHITSDSSFSYFLTRPDAGAPLAEFRFDLSDSQSGFQAFFAGDADFVLSRYELPGEFAETAGSAADVPAAKIIALDAMTLSVSPQNPMRVVPLAALPGILSGALTNWQDLGGPDLPLQVIGATDPAPEMPVVLAELTKYAQDARDGTPVVDLISRDSFAIGLTRLSDPGNAVVLRLSGACGSDFRPHPLALKTRDYPLTAPQFLYVGRNRQPRIIRAFLRFLDGDAAADLAERAGFTSRRIAEIPLAIQGERIANAVMQAGEDTGLADLQTMLLALRDARRLTLTFRFQSGSARLDTQSRADLVDLAARIEAGQWDGKELIFAGFSDGDGGADANRRIALRRANAVRAAVREQAGLMDPGKLSLRVEGFGEALPLACDDTEAGRGINRRVELWVRDARVQN